MTDERKGKYKTQHCKYYFDISWQDKLRKSTSYYFSKKYSLGFCEPYIWDTTYYIRVLGHLRDEDNLWKGTEK